MYSNIGDKFHLEYASTILACISVVVTVPIYFFYRNGPAIRERSPFAKEIAEESRRKRLLRAESAGEKRSEGGDAVQMERQDAEAAYL